MPVCEVVLGVVGGVPDGGGEDDLIVVVGVDCDVGPVEDGVGLIGSVEELEVGLDAGAFGEEGDSYEPFHAVAELDLADPDGSAAVGILGERVVDGHEGCGAVVVRDAPLDSAGDPRAEHSYQGGLDYVLAVEEIVIVGFVEGGKDTAAHLGQDAQLDILVLKIDGVVFFVGALVGQDVEHRIGIDAALCALVSPAGIEPGVLVGLADLVGGDDQRLGPDFYGRVGLRKACSGGGEQQCK